MVTILIEGHILYPLLLYTGRVNTSFKMNGKEVLQSLSSLVPRLSLSFPLDFTCAKEKLKERESLVWSRAHPWPSQPWLGKNSIEKTMGGCGSIPDRLSLSFNFSHIIMFAWAKSEGRENESLRTRLYETLDNKYVLTIPQTDCQQPSHSSTPSALTLKIGMALIMVPKCKSEALL